MNALSVEPSSINMAKYVCKFVRGHVYMWFDSENQKLRFQRGFSQQSHGRIVLGSPNEPYSEQFLNFLFLSVKNIFII